jgi:hypothetical protein
MTPHLKIVLIFGLNIWFLHIFSMFIFSKDSQFSSEAWLLPATAHGKILEKAPTYQIHRCTHSSDWNGVQQ